MSAVNRHSWMLCVAAFVLAISPYDANCNRVIQELEAYRLDDLTLVATIEHGKSWAGCFRLPDKTLRLAVPGTYFGKTYGRIDKVERGDVHFTELIPDGEGGWIERPSDLRAPASPERSVLRACRDAKEADEASRKRWEAEEKAKKHRYEIANRNLHTALLGWRWTTTQAPVVEVPKRSSWKTVVGIEHYGDGLLLVTREGDGNGITAPWHDGIYFLASPTASITRVAVKDCQTVEDVVVSNGSAYWLCLDLQDKWSLVTTKPNGERSASVLPLHADWLRLGLRTGGLLAISADTVYRQQGADWKVAFHSPTAKRSDGLFGGTWKEKQADSPFLPQRSSTPFEHAGLLYFPTQDDGNQRRLYRIALKEGAAIEESQDYLAPHYFADWGFSVHSTAIDGNHALWLASELGAVFRISAQGEVRMGSAWGDVAFAGPMLPDQQPDEPKDGTDLPTQAVLPDGKTLYLADDKAIVEVSNGKVTPLVRFQSSDEKCCDCGCGFDPRILARFRDGTFVFAQSGDGLYLLKKRGATYEFEASQVAQGYVEF